MCRRSRGEGSSFPKPRPVGAAGAPSSAAALLSFPPSWPTSGDHPYALHSRARYAAGGSTQTGSGLGSWKVAATAGMDPAEACNQLLYYPYTAITTAD